MKKVSEQRDRLRQIALIHQIQSVMLELSMIYWNDGSD